MAIAQAALSAITSAAAAPSAVAVFLAAIAAAVLLCRSAYRASRFHPLAAIPGPVLPRLSSLWLNYHAFVGDEATAVHALHERYGRVVRTGPASVDVADGAALDAIYLEKGGFLKPAFYSNFDIDGHATLFSSTVPALRAPRAKAVLPMFSTASIRGRAAGPLGAAARAFADRLAREIDRAGRAGGRRGRVNVLPAARGFALDAVTSYLLDCKYGACEEDLGLANDADKTNKGRMSAEAMVNSFVAVGKNWYLPPWAFQLYEGVMGYIAPDPQATQSISAVDAFLAGVVDQAKKDPQGASFPGRLLAAGFADDEVTAQCKDLVFAGTDSTAMNLATICFLLAKSPDKYELLRREIAAADPSDEDLQGLPYLQAVIREGLRLSMANPSRLPRVVPAAGLRCGALFVPAGAVVSCTPYELHHDPAVFADPLAFLPERWLTPGAAGDAMRRDFIPFGRGPRQCIARNLAVAELSKAVAVLAAEDGLRGLRSVGERIEILEWFNSHVKGHKIELEVVGGKGEERRT
ncbi:hypothetical protein EsH8_I_000051 [Colletotrichum jinshuiense]